MASLQKKPGSKNWYVVFRKALSPDERIKRGGRKRTRQVWLATGTADHAEAEEFLQQVRDMMERRKKGDRMRKAFAVAGVPEPQTTVFRLSTIEKFYRKTAELGPGKLKGQENVRVNQLRAFLAWAEAKRPDVEYLHEVTPQVANDYWRWMAADGKSPRTRNNNLSQLNVAWKTMAAEAGLHSVPWAMIKRDKGGGTRLKDIPLAKIEELLWHADRMVDAGDDPRETGSVDKGLATRLGRGFWSFTIRMGFYTGLREGDIATFEAGEIHRKEDCVILHPNKGKDWGVKAQVVHPLNAPWLSFVPDVDDGFFWPVAARIYNVGDGKIFSSEWKRLCRAVGIEVERKPEAGERRKRAVKLVTVHSLRHTFVTQAIAHNAELKDVSATAGHSTVAMTEHYNHGPALAAARRVAAVMPVLKARKGR